MILLRSSRKPKRSLDDIFAEDDDLDLLDVAPLKQKSSSGNSVVSQFDEITAFYEKNNRLPNINAEAFDEKILARRFNAFKNNPEQKAALQVADSYGLLSDANEQIQEQVIDKSELVTSLDDIFDDDDDLLDFDAPDIFTIRHLPTTPKAQPEERAQRQPCEDFPRYAGIFAKVQKEITDGVASIERFRHELKIQLGDCFVLGGVLGYVHEAGERLEEYSSYNARLHLIFANGTESHMLYQSLTHGLVRDKEGSKIIRNGEVLVPDDKPVAKGLVYVLATKSENPRLAPFKANLYKIGFTQGSVEERIKQAEKDKTFLEAPVRVVTTIECFNIDAHKLESLIHAFLGHQRLNVTVISRDGNSYNPREWFHAPLATVLETIKYILDGTISLYRMDNTTGKIVKK